MSAQLRRWLPWAGLLAGLVLLALYTGARPGSGLPLDPDSTAPDGTRGLVEVLRRLGTTVDISGATPAPGTAAALLLVDQLDGSARDGLLGWVRDGGVLVVADPSSPVTDATPRAGTQVGLSRPDIERRCDLPALRDVQRVAAGPGLVFRVPQGATGCFPRNGGAWLLAQPLGRGTVVRLGGAVELTNAELGNADDALLAVSLLAPRAGGSVQVLTPPPPGGGGKRLTDLIAPRVKLFAWQLVVAFGVLALWRARRLGRPVREEQPVQIPGSELVVAVGNLLQRARAHGQAAAALSDELRRLLAERLGLPAGAPRELVADTVAARTGVPRERVLTALSPVTPRDEAELVALAHAVDTVRREVTSVR